mgnify:CR=1 FL=1
MIIPNIYWKNDIEKYGYVEHNERDRKLAYFYGLYIGDGFCNINNNSYDVYMSIGKSETSLA